MHLPWLAGLQAWPATGRIDQEALYRIIVELALQVETMRTQIDFWSDFAALRTQLLSAIDQRQEDTETRLHGLERRLGMMEENCGADLQDAFLRLVGRCCSGPRRATVAVVDDLHAAMSQLHAAQAELRLARSR